MRSMFFITVKTCLCAVSERHVLYHSQDLFVCSLSSSFSFFPFLPVLFSGGPLHFVCLASQTVFLFPISTTLRHFISDIMDCFLAGEDQQQTNQSNDQASGLTLFC